MNLILCLLLFICTLTLALSIISLACSTGVIEIQKPKAKPIARVIDTETSAPALVQTQKKPEDDPAPRRLTPMDISSLATQAKKKAAEALKTVSS